VSESANIVVGELEVRPHEHLVLARGKEVPLSSREFEILTRLAEHPGWVFSSDQLAGDPDEGDYSPESVSVLISRLRHKLSAAGASDVIDTVRGFGYRLHSSKPSTDDVPESGGASRALRDACWQLQEAVIEVEHFGTPEQHRTAIEVLDQARRDLFASLAE
jgi:DNA-binding winged helix-turn-helix (wHTH) protein